ncbi:GNAT family N-acetyltransferase [Allorhizocola rhizosphaerae]|uniref:GNAT family N-acetyltransferase n=1 Tax=Allorhizocola rhizosphaerae TaxID=1872709 RepID=UPI000E3CA359|nr:GNAT family N-acetyltransferase [Allorhizocola rhizosphaerae]
MGYTVRTGAASDLEPVMQLLFTAFHNESYDAEAVEATRLVYEPERSLLAVADDDEQILGHVSAFGRELTVPGGAAVPTAFVTMVAVAPQARRRGIARELLVRQLRDMPDPLAVLWASEGRIYQRFGYGSAARMLSMNVDTREVRLHAQAPASGSRIRVGKPAALRKELTEVYEAVRLHRPGYAGRTEAWWDYVMTDPTSRRHGAGERQAIVHEGPSGVDGFALFRIKGSWEAAGPNGEVWVQHVTAANHVAYQEIWRYLMSVDLTRTASLSYGAVDEPLFEMVNEPRRLGTTVKDGLWLRVVDVPAALAARGFLTGDDLVIEVRDELLPHNTGSYRLSGERTSAPADVTMDVGALAALYLGGGQAGALAMAGRLQSASEETLARVDAAFRWHRAPAGIEMF